MSPIISRIKEVFLNVVGFVKDKVVSKISLGTTVYKMLPMAIPIALVVFIGIIIISNTNNISEKLGFDTTKTLAVKLNQEQTNSDTAVAANNKTQEAMGVIKAISVVKDQITEDLNIKFINTIKEIEKIEKAAEVKVVKITGNKNTTNIEKKQAVNEANIVAIWDSYCSFNSDSECSEKAA